ncbi:MAG: CCA tRNA nucleotidyltransferase [Elusimicrobiaceae bacterium]|nr:CCA tRNA nucleotidyltransferase [Elusimicrobiaceae bacterium]
MNIKLLKELGQIAQKHNLKIWAVGGFARDFVLHKKTKDIDICVENNTFPLINYCQKTKGASVQKFNNFGTARVTFKNGFKLDFVCCRKEIYPKPAALPIVSKATIKEDLFRRDFTCNALALSLLPGEFFKIYDLYGSLRDIKNEKVSVLHAKSFEDDPTRLYRALRFGARLNFKLSKETEILFKNVVAKNYIALLTPARKTNEIIKFLEERNPAKIFALIKKYKAGNLICPNFKVPKNIDKFKNLDERLALLILTQKTPQAFLNTLQMPKNNLILTNNLLKFYANKQALYRRLTKQEIALIKTLTPKINKLAYAPCFIDGKTLHNMGAKGKQISEILSKISALQFSGKIKTKRAAKNLAFKMIRGN